MFQFPIGVIPELFKKDIIEALDITASLGAKGLQVYATATTMAFQPMDAKGRKEFLKKVKDRGLVFSAICGDLGHSFGDPEKNPALVEESKRILDIALTMETNIVTTHIGVVPPDEKHPRYKIMQDACGALAEYADRNGAHFAVETGPETAIVLKGFLDSLNSRGVAVNLDPANLVMVTGDDPVKAVHTLKDYIVHTHAKDGRKLRDDDPEIIYGLRAGETVVESAAFIELPLGEGDVPFEPYLKALEDVGYRGFLTIEREVGGDPASDIRSAAEYLKKLMG